jgi:hypothetical protein
MTTPSKLYAHVTEFLENWVSRKTVMAFTILEALTAVGSFVFFWTHPHISTLTYITTGGIWPLLFLGFRSMASIVGNVAATCRSVKHTKFYFGTLVVNMFTTLLVCVPLYRCKCECPTIVDVVGGELNAVQCEILGDYLPDSPQDNSSVILPGTDVRRLWDRRMGPPMAGGHAARVAHAVAGIVGKPAAHTRSPESEHRTAFDLLASVRSYGQHFFSSSELAITKLFAAVSWGQSRKRRLAAGPAAKGRALSAFKRRKVLGARIMSYYNLTENGLGWRTAGGALDMGCDAKTEKDFDVTGTKLSEELNILQHGDFSKFVTAYVSGTFEWATYIGQQLESCVKQDLCGAVRLQFSYAKEGTKSGKWLYTLNTCHYNLPIYPVRLDTGARDETRDAHDNDVFFSEECDRFIEGSA